MTGKYCAAILQEMGRSDQSQVSSLWAASGLQWTDFLQEAAVDQFIADHKLEWTMQVGINFYANELCFNFLFTTISGVRCRGNDQRKDREGTQNIAEVKQVSILLPFINLIFTEYNIIIISVYCIYCIGYHVIYDDVTCPGTTRRCAAG